MDLPANGRRRVSWSFETERPPLFSPKSFSLIRAVSLPIEALTFAILTTFGRCPIDRVEHRRSKSRLSNLTHPERLFNASATSSQQYGVRSDICVGDRPLCRLDVSLYQSSCHRHLSKGLHQ